MPVGIVLFFLFIIFPLVEIYLLIRLKLMIGFGNILLLSIATALIGSYLIKNQGGGIMGTLRSSLAKGQSLTRVLVDGVCVFIAGALLITPGLISDSIGLILLVPYFRRIITKILLIRMQKRYGKQNKGFSFYASFSQDSKLDDSKSNSLDNDKIIDVEKIDY